MQPPAPAGHPDWYDAPVLTGSLVRLEPLTQAHAPGWWAAAEDDESFRWLSIPRPRTPGDAQEQVRQACAAAARGERVPWTQVQPASGRVLGTTSYYELDPPGRSLAIGHTWLARSAQRTGVNTEAKLLLLTRAFETLGAVRVVWHADIRNERSQSAIARLGATREGVLRKHRQRRDGTWRDTVQFSMLDDEWPARKARLLARLAAG